MSEFTSSTSDADVYVSSADELNGKSVKRSKYLPRLWWGLGIGVALAAGMFYLSYSAETGILPSLILSVFVLAFGASLTLEDSAVKDVMFWMATKSISFPGLIWEFSIDGFLWLIGMKLLFWLIGLIFGIICAILGVIIAIIIAPFAYPFNLYSYIKEA